MAAFRGLESGALAILASAGGAVRQLVCTPRQGDREAVAGVSCSLTHYQWPIVVRTGAA